MFENRSADPEWLVIPKDNCNQSAQLCWWDDMSMSPSNMTFMGSAANMSSLRIGVTSQFETPYSRVYTINLSQIGNMWLVLVNMVMANMLLYTSDIVSLALNDLL